MTMTTTIEEDCKRLLPDEITTEILLLLPTESLMQCKRVCKTWRALIANAVFIYSYHQKAPIAPINIHVEWVTLCYESEYSYHLHFGEYDDGSSNINPPFKHSQPIITTAVVPCRSTTTTKRNCVCSCNGLIFFISKRGTNMFVRNPFTREYVDLPLPPPLSFKRFRSSGFGYNSYTNEYKIVIIYYRNNHTAGHVIIYTLGSGRWRDKGEISPKLINGTEPAVFLNGAVHWLTEKNEIVSFDLADEEFRIVPSPASISQFDIDDIPKLGLLGGCLYVTRTRRDIQVLVENPTPDMGGWLNNHITGHKVRATKTLDIWVMDNELQSWTRKFSIPWKLADNLYASYYRPLALSKSGKLILLHKFGNKPLVSYDPKTKSSIVDHSFSNSNKMCMQIHYVKSFVSLKALGETNAVDQVYNGDQKPMICKRLLHNQIKERK